MRKILIFLTLMLFLTASPFGAVASTPEDEVLLGYRVVTGYYDIWKHNNGTWQALGKPGDTRFYESGFNFTLANISQELQDQGINTLPQLMNAYTFTRASVVKNPPFGAADYNAAGGYYGLNWEQYELNYYKYRPDAVTWTVTQNPNPEDGTSVHMAATIQLPAKPLDPSDPTVPPNGPENHVVNLKQWIEAGIIAPIGTPPTGVNVEGWRYFTPTIVAWYGVPKEDPKNCVASAIDAGVSGTATPNQKYDGTVAFKYFGNQPVQDVPIGVFNGKFQAVSKDADGNVVTSADFNPGEKKTFNFTWTAPAEGSATLTGVINVAPLPDLFAETTKDDNKVSATVSVIPPCTDIRITLTYSPPGVRPAGQNTELIATVKRANDGPQGSVPVTVNITGPTLNYSRTINLARGASQTINKIVKLGHGNHVFNGSAWPVGYEDCVPGNNTASVTINVQALLDYDVPDNKITGELMKGGTRPVN